MPLVSTPSIVLHSFEYSETSKILRLLTRDHGVQSVIAKGAQRPKSRYGGLLELFTEGIASFSLRESRDLHTLSGFDLLTSRQSLGSDLVRFGGAGLIAELILRVASEEADAALYQRVGDALDAIAAAPVEQLQPTALAQTWATIAHLGFAPALDSCINCGRALDDEEETLFDYTAGGVRCIECGTGLGGRVLPAKARTTLTLLVSGIPAEIEKPAAYWRLLDRYLAHHVLEGASLRSLEFLAKVVGSE